MATYVVDLKRKGVVNNEIIDNISWSMIKQIHPRRKGDRLCGLCNTEKTHIAIGDPLVLLNKRTEIMTRCRHRDSLVLTNNLSKHQTRRRENSVSAATQPVSVAMDTMQNFENSRSPTTSSSLSVDDSEHVSVPSTVVLPVNEPDILDSDSIFHPSTSVPPDLATSDERRRRSQRKVDYRKFY